MTVRLIKPSGMPFFQTGNCPLILLKVMYVSMYVYECTHVCGEIYVRMYVRGAVA